MMSAAMSSGLAAQAARISRSTCSSAAATSWRIVSVTGKERLGQVRRGQSKVGKYWVLRGSAVFVMERE